MTKRARTYKLRLATDGIDLFYACHARVGRQARRFIPYGATLFTALSILAAREDEDIGDMLQSPETARLAGGYSCFVGYSSELSDLAARTLERIRQSQEIGEAVTVSRLYLVALRFLAEAEPPEIMAALR